MNKKELLLRLDEWIEEQKYQEYSDNTLKQYKTNVLKFIKWLKDDEIISKDTTINYKKYLYELEPRPSTRSINTWIVELNKYLKWLNLQELTIKKIKQQVKSSTEEVLSITDYKRLLRFSKSMGLIQLHYIMRTLAMTGIRISELKYFTVESLGSNYIVVFNKGKERNIIVRQDLTRELRKYCKENKIKEGYIFKGKKNNSILCASTIWRQMKKVAGAARVNKKKVHAHSFRHLFAQVFLNEYSNNITELADILGHNSLETTRLYTRTSNSQKKDKLEKLSFK
ncbi:MAG: tyrosine-type recombinase/integrase [Bacilli bacterium]|nr:tyrosine-type recombinase/integrase [Bacilli bacterium]